MFGDDPLTFREFATREPHPVAVIHDAVLEFLRGRKDAVLQGGQAVNAYVAESRWTEDVDIASPRAAELAEEVRSFLNHRFGIDVRVREMKKGVGFRVDQTKELGGGRHLLDVRPVSPPAESAGEKGTRSHTAGADRKQADLHGWPSAQPRRHLRIKRTCFGYYCDSRN